jgi:tRNA nucleotidyltransferase (CCA-adding enzyme)
MHIILTHEQADFDAIASLLGAHLLLETAIPVLPRRMNRNVRAFLALYGAELPFVDPRDLPPEPVEKVTLVDTQSSVSVRGMSAETRMEAIDHHPLREGLPPAWLVTTHDTGATTTVLVEELQEHNGSLSLVQATLLLLGIYEDTGSLTYTRTTGRDLRAAALLLEQGASLSIAADFLNHPLSQAQQALYDYLRTTARTLNIHGHAVVVTTGQALDMDEELSSITHKLRDLLDPDAIFVLVTTRGGVQFIARSTSDHIDVATIAARFGGGGHERASACLIRGRDLASVETELLASLPDYVRPAVTVAQIMSLGPQVLRPDTPVEEAHRRMRLYGYEGYPVVDQGQVVGLLTRRSVDRTISHRLNYPVARIMEAGSHTVTPNDSIEHVQRLVTETGWGQIPVVDPETREIVGIVTRTDLLKNLAPEPQTPGRLNLATRLETALPVDRLVLLQAIAEEAFEQRSALYIVGGFVRDLLLERPSLDFDLVVEGDAIALARALARRFGGRVTGHSRFGTAKWRLDERGDGRPCNMKVEGLASVDLVSARTEFYTHPTALPTVERGSIKLDLHRRDFTINTLALRLDGRHYGELHDYWGGLADLRAGLVRVLHSLSFVDDPTRILRAVRFEQRFAFRIEKRTMQLLLEARPLIERLSGDRLRHELNHILSSGLASQMISRLHELDLLSVIHPQLTWDDWLYARLERLESIDPEPEWGLNGDPAALRRDLGYTLWLIQLEPEQADGVTRRLKLPVPLIRVTQAACALWHDRRRLAAASPSQATLRLEDTPPLARYALYLATSDAQLRAVLQNFVTHWQHIQPVTDGHALRKSGLTPGPRYRQVLSALRTAWLDGEVQTPEEEQALLEKLLQDDPTAETGHTAHSEASSA